MAQCPLRGVGLQCVADYKVRPDGKCAFCGGTVGRLTDGVVEDITYGHPVPGLCQPPQGSHLAIVYAVDGTTRHLCVMHLLEIYRRSG